MHDNLRQAPCDKGFQCRLKILASRYWPDFPDPWLAASWQVLASNFDTPVNVQLPDDNPMIIDQCYPGIGGREGRFLDVIFGSPHARIQSCVLARLFCSVPATEL